MSWYSPYLPILEKALRKTDVWRSSFGDPISSAKEMERIEEVIKSLQKKLEGNYPFHHPQYAGQMLKPPHPAAWIAQSLAATINPNNHALDGGPPTSEMEKEVVDGFAQMIGYEKPFLGHLTSAGTIANLEALFVAREIHPNKKIAATSQAHYTHQRMCRVLNTPFLEIPVDVHGKPEMDFLEESKHEIGTLVVSMGTTGLGAVEPLADLVNWAEKHGIRIHVDAAYGGFFKIIADQLTSSCHWDALSKANSIVIDPHKHGLQPYGCGSILFKDASVGQYYKHDSPYTYFTSDDLHLGEISLECSRAGAAAAALWTTLQLLPLNKTGLGELLQQTVDAANLFSVKIEQSNEIELYQTPELDIVAYFPVSQNRKTSEVSALSKKLFKAGMEDKKEGFHLSLFTVSAEEFITRFPNYSADKEKVTILRSVLMKPEHLDFIPELVRRLHQKLG
ncbi:MAG: pyridoxal-dependent decarboxylase [Balneolaceae bacterium]